MSKDGIIDEKDMAYIHNCILFSLRMNRTVPFTVAWMDLKIVMQSE